jgi:ABC-type ATPase involved in cell division
MNNFNASGTTIVVATHNTDLVRKYSKTVIRLVNGSTVDQIRPEGTMVNPEVKSSFL